MFIGSTKKSINQIKDLLSEMLNLYNKLNDENLEYDNVFDEPYIYTKELYEKDKTEKEWNWGYEKEENIGKLIIMSKTDNSIPYSLFELIENLFDNYDYQRYHLG
jgi:hypothetical protein